MSSSSSIDSDLAGFLIQKFKSSLESARSSHELDPMFITFQEIIDKLEEFRSSVESQTWRYRWILLLYELNDVLSHWLIHKEHKLAIINNIFSFFHAAHHRLDARELRLRFYDSIPDPSPKKRERNFDLDRFTFFEPGSSSSPTVGFQDHQNKIVDWLTAASSGEGFKAVGVYGIGGSGKTTLVKQILENGKVEQKFKGNIIWVCLSHLTSSDEVDISILKYMLNYLDYDLDRLTDGKDETEDWLISQLKEKLLKLDKYVIVLDDLWHCNKWISEFYNKVAEDNNAAIIVTSRKEEVVRKLVKKNTDNKGGNVIHLDPWKYMDNNSDFIKDIIVSQNKNLVNDNDMDKIISRCHGLALAANKLPQMMIPSNSLNGIAPSSKARRVLVKVDASFLRPVSWRDSGDILFPQRVLSIDLIVFDEKGTRMIVKLAEEEVMIRFANLLKKERTFYLTDFEVLFGGEGVHEMYHIRLLPQTVVQEYFVDTPEHAFDFWDVTSIRMDKFPQNRVRDFCGRVCPPVDFDFDFEDGLITPKLEFDVEDRNGDIFSVRLRGLSADRGWNDYAHFCKIEKLVVIIQYANVVDEDGELSVVNYESATSVFWNPTFNNFFTAKRMLLGMPGRA